MKLISKNPEIIIFTVSLNTDELKVIRAALSMYYQHFRTNSIPEREIAEKLLYETDTFFDRD